MVGRSNIVGKPMAQLLLRESCTVTVAHSRTRDLAAVCARADILVAAVGRPGLVKADWVKPGATVIDVGINRVAGADGGRGWSATSISPASPRSPGAITPVPGGVGPMTIACLLANTLAACCRINGLPEPEISGRALAVEDHAAAGRAAGRQRHGEAGVAGQDGARRRGRGGRASVGWSAWRPPV